MSDWEQEKVDLDLGDGHTLRYFCFRPDRELNPQYAGIPDIEKAGAIVSHLKPDGTRCWSGINFDHSQLRQVYADDRHFWKVESWEPLTLSPSLLCRVCGDHGFIRESKWVRA